MRRERARLAANVRRMREWRNLRQEGLAHLAGISWRNLQRIEAGSSTVGIDAYIRVAHALKVSLSSLLSDDWSSPSEVRNPFGPGGGEGGGTTPWERHGNARKEL